MKILNFKESDGKCEECSKIDELRPYGKDGKWICYDCGMIDEKETAKNFQKLLKSDDNVMIQR